MTNKARGNNTHEAHQKLITETVELFKTGKIISEKNLKVGRQKFKTILVAVKKERGLDVLSIGRGHKTIGWILASELIK